MGVDSSLVDTRAAEHEVASSVAGTDAVISAFTTKTVVASSSHESVVSTVALYQIMTSTPAEEIVAARTHQLIVPGSSYQAIVAGETSGQKLVVSASADHGIGPEPTVEAVVVLVSYQAVGSERAFDVFYSDERVLPLSSCLTGSEIRHDRRLKQEENDIVVARSSVDRVVSLVREKQIKAARPSLERVISPVA